MSKILIIEDDREIAEIERDYLELDGFAADIASDGVSGLEKSLTGSYDLILLDLMLPGMDGFSVCKRLREKLDIPILMVTARTQGPIVRNGMLMRNAPLGDMLVFYENGEMKTFSADGFDLEAESAKGILDVWSFGPALLDSEGKSISGFTDTVAGANPRSAIGYYEPGHYCFVAVNGREAEGSYGYTLDELSKLFEDLGCTAAYNLDGGQSSVMVWDGGSVTVNMPADGGRPVGDIIYISKE